MNSADSYASTKPSPATVTPARPVATATVTAGPTDPAPPHSQRRSPSRWQSIRILALADLGAMASSWLCRGFVIATILVNVLELKGMQAEQKVASQMLEAVYATYILVWMHGVIFIAGAALSREQDCLNDAILSRGVTRGEYMSGKLLARSLAIMAMVAGVLLPCSFWAIRQDKLVRNEGGFVTSNARNTKIEAWEPQKVFAGADGRIVELKPKLGDAVKAGDLLAQLDDRQLFDTLETERRAEETAHNEIANARRHQEDAERAVAQAEDALARAERSLIGKDLLSRQEQVDRETDVRTRKRDLQNAANQLSISQDAITTAERQEQNAQARVRDARKRLGYATVTAPLSGYITELNVQAAQQVTLGTHLFTVAPLDELQLKVPIYDFDEFKRLKKGLTAYVKVGATEFTGTIDRLGAMTQDDRWGRPNNYAVVRFKGDGTLGLLGQWADVRLVLPPRESQPNRLSAIYNAITGSGGNEVKSRTSSVTTGWMLIALGKVVGCCALLVSLTLFLATLFRSSLIAILGTIGLWHISNLVFDFGGLPDLSYLEMVRTMDKVLGGVAATGHELASLAWLFGISIAFACLTLSTFVSRDPPK